jgi:hypothetical protein
MYRSHPVQHTAYTASYDGRGPTRTGDPLGVNEVLWPTELRAPLGVVVKPSGQLVVVGRRVVIGRRGNHAAKLHS